MDSDKMENKALDKRELLEQLMRSQASRFKIAPLSFAQRRLHFIHNLKPNSSIYNIFRMLRLIGDLNVQSFTRALNEIVRRHDSFRTKFQSREGRDIQIVMPFLGIDLSFIENSELSIEEREEKVLEYLKEDKSTPFNLSEGPLFRFRLYKITDDKHIFAVCLHHIITDGWSMRIFYNELSNLYSAFVNDRNSPLEELPIQYIDYSNIQQENAKSERLKQQLAYWKGKLKNSPIIHQLPLDFVRPDEQIFQGERVNFEIDTTLIEALNGVSQETMSTMFMITLTAYSILISRCSNTCDVILGTPIANRNKKEIESLIGFFINNLVVRVDISENITFRELLGQVKNTLLEASDNQDVTFDQIVEELQPERNLNHSPIVQLVFAYHNLPAINLNLSGIQTEVILTNETSTSNDLEVHLNYSNNQISGYFNFNKSLFLRERIERMVEYFINILKNLSSNLNQNVWDFNFLSEKEKHFIIHDLNPSVIDYPKGKSVCELFEEQVGKNPGNDAIVFENQRLTYEELNERGNQLVLVLKRKGVIANSIVGVYMERGIDLVIGLIGIIKAGGAYLPIDFNTPLERVNNILRDSNARCVLVDSKSSQVELLNSEKINIGQNEYSSAAISNPELINTPNDLFYIIYTSGTTGTPKGVPIKHLGFLNLINNYTRIFNVDSNSRLSQISNIGFDAMCLELWPCLASGACLHIIDEATKYNSIKVKQFIIEHGITHAFLPTVYAEDLVSEEWPLNISLKCLLTGGDKLKKYSRSTHPFRFYNLYGPTEDTVWTTCKEVKEKPTNDGNLFPSIGIPLTNKKVYILDKRNNLMPIGVYGELCISGIGLSGKYINGEELSSEKYTKNPFDKDEVLYKTGDLARWLPNKEIEIFGRIDNQVKINGFRIELGEIEQCLHSYYKIKEVSVIIKESFSNKKDICAFYTSEEDLNPRELKDYLQKVIPNYMIPSFFVRLEKIPLTSSGKVDKKALFELHIQPVVDDKIYDVPRNNFEENIIDIWKELLNLQVVGVNDNFFDVGGHSLLIAKLTNLIKNKTGIELDVLDIFRYPTIRSICNNFANTREDDMLKDCANNTEDNKKVLLNKILGNRKKLS